VPEPPYEPAPAEAPAVRAQVDGSSRIVFDAFQFTTFQQILDALGIDRDYAAWARARGDPDLPGLAFEGYADMPDETLRSLADQGDATALQMLASRLMTERPLESLDLLRQQADDGSAYAIGQMASQLRFLAETLEPGRASIWDPEQQARLRLIGADASALRTEAMAWTLLDEIYLGRPRGSLVTDRFVTEAGAMPVELGAACERAGEIYDQLRTTWQSRQVEAPPSGAPPLGHGAPEPGPGYVEACPMEALPTPDLSACKSFSMVFQEGEYPVEWEMYACP
jgi:hypothetical protein